MIDIPIGLRHALESGDCVLFIGAGIGDHLLDPRGKAAPDAQALAKNMASYFSIDVIDSEYDLAIISKIVELRKGRAELEAYLCKQLENLTPDENLRWLFSLRWRAIFTTNYDRGIQRAYELNANPPQKPITITRTPEIVAIDNRFEVPIYHLHGSLFSSAKPHIIITEDDYSRFRVNRKMLFNILKLEFATSAILYIGYSNRDPNWRMVLDEITTEFYPSPMPNSYRVAPGTNPLENEILKSRGIETINASYEEFYRVAAITITESKVDPGLLHRLRLSVPQDLLSAFEKNPPATARLLASWTYVNQAPFHEVPNFYNFLRGDRANWALIGARLHFERDIEDECYSDLLDYATGTSKRPSVTLILAPAGYGVTTLIMTLASKLVTDRAGAVFMLKPGSALIEGDIDFASSLFPNRPFFFVDNAADHVDNLSSIIQRLKETGRTAMFILGERLNEWRQSHGRIGGREHEIEPLSDPEIERLLECLSKHRELNMLEHLTQEQRFAAVKINYRKELLVAMREATEGKSFDAILVDEYWGIKDSISRKLYLTVCCFYQSGAYLRAELLSEMMNVSLPELYHSTKDATEGVVIYELVDENKGAYVARARHRIIAKVVWECCAQSGDREELLQSALAKININYKYDYDAFDHFIRSDRIVDSIRSLDGKIQFFEKGCQKDPDSPYVRQHYARMLSRADRAELALEQIDEAIKLNPRQRILYHTKGVILKQIALSTESVEFARRRLMQSEANFRQALSMYRRDEYSYQGLSQLYIGWAKRAKTTEESADYIAKAESVISEGLLVVRVRDALWIESSNIQLFLGNNPSHIKALERAVNESPGGIVARYLLGRSYRKGFEFLKAMGVLEPIIKNHPDEYRVFLEYALCLVYLKKPYRDAIAILNLSTLYGYGDPRFLSTLGGLLFLTGEFSKAEKVFAESTKRDFTSAELNTVQFRPPAPDDIKCNLRIKGRVVRVKAGVSFVDCAGYPRFICPASKYRGVMMQPGISISFEIAFNAKGPIADHPMLDDL